MIVTGGIAVPTAVLTWPTTTTSSPSPSKAVRGVPTSSILCKKLRTDTVGDKLEVGFVMGPSLGLPPYPHRVNVGCGPAEERVLLTGLHAVADIHCENCKTTLGWKYEQAFESSQKYKEGKYIIELNHMIKDNGWD
ncbi:yippee like 3 [Phyllostomus discolor]|uniref:Protein yippee-like n=1 Tax=Phyllostomus discolor TaxID=89673 RepID=A0A834EVR9_9CHIR|nr:yippee like 3 [Phyllostomus discolor]